MKNIDNLFQEIREATGVEDIGYHRIKNEKLNPIYKSKTGELELEKWIEIHSQNPVYIANNLILQEIVKDKKTIVINDVKADYRSTQDVTLFGIDSLMMIPVIKEDIVIGIVPIVSIGKIHNFSDDDVIKCETLVRKYYDFLIVK